MGVVVYNVVVCRFQKCTQYPNISDISVSLAQSCVCMASYRKAGSTVQQTVSKPPKPPCWLDLKGQSQTYCYSDEGSKSSPVNSQGQTLSQALRPSSSSKTKRTRRRAVHRTVSQHKIDPNDLPGCELVTLADTDPKDIGIGKPLVEDTLYFKETNKKCQDWLESIEGCGPPEEQSVLPEDTESGSVDVEVPDQTPNYDEGELWHHKCDSVLSAEEEFGENPPPSLRPQLSSIHRSQTQKSRLKGSGKKYHYDVLSRDLPVMQ